MLRHTMMKPGRLNARVCVVALAGLRLWSREGSACRVHHPGPRRSLLYLREHTQPPQNGFLPARLRVLVVCCSSVRGGGRGGIRLAVQRAGLPSRVLAAVYLMRHRVRLGPTLQQHRPGALSSVQRSALSAQRGGASLHSSSVHASFVAATAARFSGMPLI